MHSTSTRPHVHTSIRRSAPWALLLLVGAVLAYLYGEIDWAGRFAGVDLRHYRLMAQAAPGLSADRPQPFAFRIGGPWLAGLLPLRDPAAFLALAVVASLGLLAAFYGYLRRVEGVAAGAAAVAGAVFALNPYLWGFNVFNPFQVGDTVGLLALVGAFWALERRHWGWLAVALALGALFRETALLALPAVAVRVLQRDRRDAGPAALAVLPAVGVFVALRLLVPHEGGLGLGEALVEYLTKVGRPTVWFRLLVGAFAPLSLFPLVFWPTARAFFRARLHYLVYGLAVLASCFFGGDNERLMQPAFLPFYAFVAVVVERHLGGRRWALALVLLCAWAASLHHLQARFPLPDQGVRLALLLGALAVATGVAVAVRMREGSEDTKIGRREEERRGRA